MSKDGILSKNNISIISKGFNIEGNLSCPDTLDIEGKIIGDIIGNVITLREGGEIVGNITAKILNLKGKFEGNIKSEKINIATKADVKGTLEYVSLCVEDGAKIEGELKKINELKSEDFKKNIVKDSTLNNKENKINK